MTTREEFNAWWNETWTPVFEVMPGAMQLAWKEVAEVAWQASRAASLEEAAKECELTQKHFDTQDAIDAAEQCAMGIRALKD